MTHLSQLPDTAQILIGATLGIIVGFAFISGIFALISIHENRKNSDHE